MTARDETTGEFYVGYLPGPPGYVRFLRLVVPAVLLAAVALGGLVIRAHNNPGDATWETDAVLELAGVIDVQPYAMLRIAGATPDRPVETLLLVGEGKFGARDRAEPFRARTVRVRGTLLSRQGRRLFEIADGDGGIEPIDARVLPGAARLLNPVAERMGEAILRGEIIDPKCYFGAMKPGEGKAHKDCAALCISGGIPPMFAVRGLDGSLRHYLLTDRAGDAVNDRVLPYVADPVEIDGLIEWMDDLPVFRIDPATIRRL